MRLSLAIPLCLATLGGRTDVSNASERATHASIVLATAKSRCSVSYVRLSDGKRLWTTELETASVSPWYSNRGRLLFFDDGCRGKIIAVCKDTGRALWSYNKRMFGVFDYPHGIVLRDGSEVVGLDPADGTVRWRRETYGLAQRWRDRLFHATRSRAVIALDPRSGRRIWEFSDVPTDPAVQVFGDSLFCYSGSQPDRLICLDPASGEKKWESTLKHESGYLYSCGDSLLVTDAGLNVTCIGSRKGDRRWECRGGYNWPSCSSRVLVTASDQSGFVCLDSQTGSKVWEAKVGGGNWEVGSTREHAVVRDYALKKVTLFNLSTGARLCELPWGVDSNRDLYPVVDDMLAFYHASDHEVACVDLRTLEERWRCDAGDSVQLFAPVDRRVLIVTSSSILLVSALDKRRLWAFPCGGRLWDLRVHYP